MGFTTKQVHAGVTPDPMTGAILTPIYQSTTFVQESVDQYLSKGFSYSRSGNPTVRALEQKIAVLENGVGCTCYSTGHGGRAGRVPGDAVGRRSRHRVRRRVRRHLPARHEDLLRAYGVRVQLRRHGESGRRAQSRSHPTRS